MNEIFDYGGNSKPDWQGLTSAKFGYAEKKHFESKDMMKTVEGADHPVLGRKHFTPTYSGVRKEKLCLKTFPNSYKQSSESSDGPVKQKQEFVPTGRKFGHREKTHLYQEGGKEKEYLASIKTFYPLPNDAKEAHFEKTMGRKRMVDSMEDQRNLLDLQSLGDKAYKSPEYSTNFYKEGGMVPGSTHKMREQKAYVTTIKLDTTEKKGTKWSDRVKQEELAEEEKAVKSLSEWEQTTLKEGNPKWRDPDAVEVEAPKKQDIKIEQKNVKKPAAKK